MKLASFDIFDTTLIRKCGRPENVFYLLARSLYPMDVALQNEFYLWRLNAEDNANRKLQNYNITIHDIYSVINEFGKDIDADICIEKERQLECSLLISNYNIKQIISKRRSEGYAICFVSDMYLDSALLKSVLMREGCANKDDDVFVSCECGCRKDNGKLFQFVRDYYGNITEWLHYGDNKRSDYINAKKNGITPCLINSQFNRCEEWFIKRYESYPFGKELSTFVGFQRCARLHLSNDDVKYSIAADFIASIMIPYLCYIRSVVSKKHIKRLYFLSRDSNLLYQLAIGAGMFENVECRYLFLSRKSLSLPMFTDISKKGVIDMLGGKVKGKTYVEILKLLKVDDLYPEIIHRKIKNENDVEYLVDLLKQNESLIRERQLNARQLLDEYFKQEGLIDDVNCAMVDVGWFGTTRMMINKWRKQQNLSSLPFIYLGTFRDVLGRKFGDYYSFLPYEFLSVNRTILIEAYYCSSRYPSTIAYKKSDNKVVPVFDTNDYSDNHLLSTHIKVCDEILSYIEGYFDIKMSDTMNLWWCFIELFDIHPEYIDYSTMKQTQSLEKGMIVKKISLYELLKFLIIGKKKDGILIENSIYYTYGIKIKRGYSLYDKLKVLKARLAMNSVDGLRSSKEM